MEEMKYKRRCCYLIFALCCSMALHAAAAYIVNDQKAMYADLVHDYDVSQKAVTDLGALIEMKDAEIKKLESKIPV